MKTNTLKKSLLDYAIKGHLSAKWRRLNTANAFSDIESYNAQILKDKKAKEKELKSLESKLKNINKLTQEDLKEICKNAESQKDFVQVAQSQAINKENAAAQVNQVNQENLSKKDSNKESVESLKNLKEKAKKILKAKISALKKDIEKLKIITPLNVALLQSNSTKSLQDKSSGESQKDSA